MKKNNKKIKYKSIIVLLFVLFLAVSFYISNRCVFVKEIDVCDDKIPSSFDGMKILELTDLHDEEYGKNNSKLIDKIDNIGPDIIFMAGDMITSTDVSYEPFYTLTENLVKKYKIYYVVGNHEQAIQDEKLKALKKSLKDISKKEGNEGKIEILDNKCKTIKKDNEKINIYGMWINLKHYVDARDEEAKKEYFFDEKTMEETIGKSKEGYNILLTHNPVYFNTYSQWGANLVVSGHMHGGMVYVPLVGGLFSPEKEWFPKYYGGKYETDDSNMIVGTGLGNGDMGFRMFNSPSIYVINLLKR